MPDCWLAMLPSAGKACWTPQCLTGLGLSSCTASQSVEPTGSQARSRRHSEWPPKIGTNGSSSRQRSSRLGGELPVLRETPLERHRGVALRRGRGLLPPLLRSLTSAPNPKVKPLCLGTWRREKGPSWASRPLEPTNRRFDGPQLLNSTPVGARLWNFPREWDNLTTDRYVRSIVRDGYRVELISPPPLSLVPIPMKLFRNTEQSNALLREIMSLLDKGAIEELDPRSLAPGFYSRLFLVPKTDGSYRPVFDLKSLNQFVHKEKFKMTTPRAVTNVMHKGDRAVSIVLKDAYFHVPIHVRSRRLLRFAIATNDGLRVFQFRALPFGLTSAPRVLPR